MAITSGSARSRTWTCTTSDQLPGQRTPPQRQGERQVGPWLRLRGRLASLRPFPRGASGHSRARCLGSQANGKSPRPAGCGCRRVGPTCSIGSE